MLLCTGFREAPESCLFLFCAFFRLRLRDSSPALDRPTAPARPHFPASGSSAHRGLSVPSPHPTLGSQKGVIALSSGTGLCPQRTGPISHADSAPGLSWRKRTFFPYKALFGPERLDKSQWTWRAAEWVEPGGGTDIWQGGGVSGLDCVWIEGVGLRRGVRQCGCRWGAGWGGS